MTDYVDPGYVALISTTSAVSLGVSGAIVRYFPTQITNKNTHACHRQLTLSPLLLFLSFSPRRHAHGSPLFDLWIDHGDEGESASCTHLMPRARWQSEKQICHAFQVV